MIEQIGRKTLREYLNLHIEVVPICLGRLEAFESLPISSIKSQVKSGLGYANAFLVEGFLALGAAIGICLVAAIVKGGW
jgi:Na+-transporting NADH:ubiquinone oxidoreductase subunit NqrD